jgi:branched-subunit amino acid transport protein
MTAVTFATRYAGIAAAGRKLPEWFQSWLKFVPVAVLAALIAPAALAPDGVITVGAATLPLLVGLVAAWRTRNVLWTILAGLPGRWKVALAFWMTDESYALAITEYRQGRGSPQFFLGASWGVYLVWPISGLIGALAGTAIPDPARWGLDLIFPLAFMGLLVTFMEDWTSIVVAIAAGVIALVSAQLLPGTWYVIVAGVLASTLGLALERGRGNA